MEKQSRLENSKRNIAFGLLGRVLQLPVKFALRTAVIYLFGAAYLGLDGLFANVIAVLSISELGIGAAVCFALYGVFASSNYKAIASYMAWYGKVYRILGSVIFVLGCLCLPFLRYIVRFDSGIHIQYHSIYCLFLMNTAASYWFGAHYQTVFFADQREYVVNNVKNGIFVLTTLLQITLLFLFRNYYLYLIVMIAGTIATNQTLALLAKRSYPQIFTKESAPPLNEPEKRNLRKNILALSFTKISTVIYASSDNIIISAMIGTLAVGYYSNYAYVVSAVTGLVCILFNSMQASIGNAYALESPETMLTLFRRLLFLNAAVYGFCFVCFMTLFQDFIRLWAGETYLLDSATVYVIGLLFLLPGFQHVCIIFKDACGLFWETRYRAAATALINIFTSILLAPRFGLAGVLAATIVAYFLTSFSFDPRLIAKKVLRCSPMIFYSWYLQSVLKAVAIHIAVSFLCGRLSADSWPDFFLKMTLVIFLTAAFFWGLNIPAPEYRYYKELITHELQRWLRRA